jgi:iron(III) transport system substrate-binding protein
MEAKVKYLALLLLPILAATGIVKQAYAADTLVVYSSLDTADPAAKAFTKKTGIQVNLVSLSTGELLGKVAAEGDHPQFDVLWVEGSAVMNRLAQEQLLKGEPGLVDQVDYTDLGRRLVPQSQAYFPISVSTTAIAVNAKKVSSDQMPTRWADLARFAGTVAAKDPNLSGPAFQWLAGYFQVTGVEHGKSELAKILTNKAMSGIPSGESVNRTLISGDAAVAIQQDTSIYDLIAKGEPIRVAYPADGVVALPSSAGVGTHSRHEDAAKAFIRFLLSSEGQQAMLTTDGGDGFFAPVVKGVQGNGKRIDNTASWVILDDNQAAMHESEWKKWFRDQFVP